MLHCIMAHVVGLLHDLSHATLTICTLQEFIVTDSTVCKYLEDFISAASLHSSPVLLLGDSKWCNVFICVGVV